MNMFNSCSIKPWSWQKGPEKVLILGWVVWTLIWGDTVDEELRRSPPGISQNLVNNGINYQPQLVNFPDFSEPWTVRVILGWSRCLSFHFCGIIFILIWMPIGNLGRFRVIPIFKEYFYRSPESSSRHTWNLSHPKQTFFADLKFDIGMCFLRDDAWFTPPFFWRSIWFSKVTMDGFLTFLWWF